MFLGRYPSLAMLKHFKLQEYDQLCSAVKTGNIKLLRHNIDQYRGLWIRKSLLILLDKLKVLAYINLKFEYSKIVMRIISFIFSFTSLLLVRARHRIPNQHNAATINYVARGTIADKRNYLIDGAQLTVQSGSTVLGQGQSEGDGTFSITGTMQAAANNQYTAELIVSVGNGAYVEKFPMTASISSGTVAFTSSQSGRFQLNANDMTSTSIYRSTIQGQVTDKTSGKGVPNDELQFTIVGVNANDQIVTQNAVATTDSQGNFKIYTILQYLKNFAGGYVSSCSGYFNTIQMDLYGNSPPFYLNPSNSYQTTLKIQMITGTITQTIIGIVNSETTKQPLPGVNVDLSYVTLSKNQSFKNISSVQTDIKGSFILTLGVPIYEINFELYFTLSHYLPVSQNYQSVYNLSDSTQTVYSENIGTIQLVPAIPQELRVGLLRSGTSSSLRTPTSHRSSKHLQHHG